MPSTHVSRFTARDFTLMAVIALAVLVVYWPVRSFGSIYVDDPDYVFANAHVLAGLNGQTFIWAFTSQTGGLWQPLTMLSFLFEVRLHGPQPGLMHLDNVILHALSSVGWYVLLRGVTGRTVPAFFAAAIFALHPARVESVAWITERKDVLSMFMLVVSLIAYWRYTRRRSWAAYLACLGLFALALMSKAMVVTQPVLMLLLDAWPLGRTKWFPPELPDRQTQPLSVWSLVMEKIPFFALSVLDSFIALRTQAIFGARPDLQLLPISNRIATALVGYVKYAGILFWPRNLAAYYPYQMNLPPSAAVASAILLLTITAVTIGLRKHRPYLMVGWCWFIIALVPVGGLFQAGDQALADRFTYLPSMGLTVAVVWLMAGDARTRQYISLKVSAMMCGTVAVLACAVLSRGYLYNWSDTITLFTHAAEVNGQPDSRIELLLGDAYTAAHRPDVAIDHYDRSLQLNPSSSAAHVNLANLLLPYSPRMALPHYRAAVELKPNSGIDHYDYAVCLQALGRKPEADREFAEARRLRLIAPQ